MKKQLFTLASLAIAAAASAQCPGDLSTAPILVNTTPYSTSGNTNQACYTNNIGNTANDVFYLVALNDCASSITVSMCGSSFDTYLRIYNKTLTTQLAFNDDGCGLQSIISNFAVTGGDTLFVVVEGFGSGVGSYVLNITQNLTTPNANINYNSGYYFCQNGGNNPSATITGTAGGSFASLSGTADVVAATGQVILSNSAPGLQQIVYTAGNGTCIDRDTAAIFIDPTDNASFNYAPLCVGATTGTPVVTGLTGGTFSASAGAVIDATTGALDLSAMSLGTYQVSYATNGVCPTVGTQSVTFADPAFDYAETVICSDDANISPVVTGTTGGSFASTSGLVFANNGTIDVTASTAGTYTIEYSVGGCTATDEVTIAQRDNADFTYGATTFCTNSSPHPEPTLLGTPGGAFSSTTGLPVQMNTGSIIVNVPNLNTAITHTVTYGTTGICPASSTLFITINPADVAAIAYDSAAFCLTNTTDPVATITGLTGGTFAAPAGVVVDANTGAIDLSASSAGIYSINYTTNGICPSTVSATVMLDACLPSGVADIASESAIRLFPNPNNGRFAIELQSGVNQVATVQILNNLGQLMQEQAIELVAGMPIDMQLHQFAAGSYYVRVVKANGELNVLKMTVVE